MTGMVDAPSLADHLVFGFLMDALVAIPSCLSSTDGVRRMAGHIPTPFTEVCLRGVESATAEDSETTHRLEFHPCPLRMSEETVGRRCQALQ